MTDQMKMEIEELKASLECQKQEVLAYKALMEYWRKQSFEANNMLGQVCEILSLNRK